MSVTLFLHSFNKTSLPSLPIHVFLSLQRSLTSLSSQTMSLRRSFLARRINHRSFTLSKSFKEFKFSENRTVVNCNINDDNDEKKGEENGEFRQQNGVVEELGPSGSGTLNPDSWANMLPEILGDIIQRVEESEDKWPQRQNVVACGCVCKQWRNVTKDVVEKASVNQAGNITFPPSLKKPGPRDSPHQCLVKRDKKSGTFYLYLAFSPSFLDEGKFLLAARRYRNGTHIEYIISIDANDLSQRSNSYVGKLRSDFLGTNFTIYDSQPPHGGAKPLSSRVDRRLSSNQISPQVSAANFEIGQVSYKFNLLKSRGPRRMICSVMCPSSDGTTSVANSRDDLIMKSPESNDPGYTILKNKAPRWHEQLECWCLNFHGRVTVASVKNFQLVAIVDQSRPGGKGDEETVLLQFGKVADDTFTMDYRQPLSAFQAFAICLTSFGTKLACE